MALEGARALARVHVPQLDRVILRSAGEYVALERDGRLRLVALELDVGRERGRVVARALAAQFAHLALTHQRQLAERERATVRAQYVGDGAQVERAVDERAEAEEEVVLIATRIVDDRLRLLDRRLLRLFVALFGTCHGVDEEELGLAVERLAARVAQPPVGLAGHVEAATVRAEQVQGHVVADAVVYSVADEHADEAVGLEMVAELGVRLKGGAQLGAGQLLLEIDAEAEVGEHLLHMLDVLLGTASLLVVEVAERLVVDDERDAALRMVHLVEVHFGNLLRLLLLRFKTTRE